MLLLQRPTFPPLGFLLQDIDDPFDALLEPLVHLGVAAIHSLLANHSWKKVNLNFALIFHRKVFISFLSDEKRPKVYD